MIEPNRAYLFLISSALLLVAGCSGDAQECFEDRTCGLGMHCNQPKFGERGTCEACAASETPYDGIDNDCSQRTPDLDLDGDGDNAITSTIRPGTDCDDNDALVKPGARELCDDRKDNDCDGKVDERDCADHEAPSVSILSPREGALVAGVLSVVVDAIDDVGLTQAVISVNGVSEPPVVLGDVASLSMRELLFNSTDASDGLRELQVVVTDIAGNTATDRVMINIDNNSGPEIVVTRPSDGRAYGGSMNVEVTLTDPSGVADATLLLDGVEIRTATSALTELTLTQIVDTRAMSEGPHTLAIAAREAKTVNPVTTNLEVAFRVDNIAPTVSIIEPLDAAELTGTAHVRVEATDLGSTPVISMAGTTGPAPLDFDLDTSTFTNGGHVLTAIATDDAEVDGGGPNSASDSITVRVTNVNMDPTVQITSHGPGASVYGVTEVLANISASNGRAISQVRYLIDSGAAAIDSLAPYSGLVDFAGLSGVHTLSVEARDNLGGIGVDSIQVNVVAGPSLRTAQPIVAGRIDSGSYDVGDLDGDGVPDLAISGVEHKVIFGSIAPSGVWLPADQVPTGSSLAYEVQVVDIEGNGRMRVLTDLGNGVEILYFVGRMPVVETVFAGAGSLTSMVAGDLDGDNDLDLVMSGGTNVAVVMRWNGTTYLPDPPVVGLGGVSETVLADLDEDGDLDLVVARTGAVAYHVLSVLLNDGTGHFGSSLDTPTPSQPERVGVADMNGDNYPDIIIQYSQTAEWGRLTGVRGLPGIFTLEVPVALGAVGGSGLVVDDFDGDGLEDIMFGLIALGGVEVWTNRGALPAERTGAFSLIQGAQKPKLRDLNGDGRRDLLVASPVKQSVAVAYGLVGGDFYAAPIQLLPTAQAPSMAAGDLTGSSEPELVVGTSGPNQIMILGRNGSKWDTLTTLPSGVPTSLTLGDLDGAGERDIAVGAPGGASLLLQQAPLSFSTMVVGVALEGPGFGPLGDGDNDGTTDLSMFFNPLNPTGAGVRLLNLTTLTTGDLLAVPAPSQVLVGNFDSDPANTNEVAVLSLVNQSLTVGTWTGLNWVSASFAMPAGTLSVTSADLDNDGRLDIIAAGSAGFSVLLGNPVMTFGPPQLVATSGACVQLAVKDMDRDGTKDVVVTQIDARTSVFIQSANGTFLAPKYLPSIVSPGALFVDDFDGDGLDDIIVGQTGNIPGIISFFSQPFQ